MKFSLEWTEAHCPFGSLQFDSLIYTLYALKEHTNNHVQRFSIVKLYSAHYLFTLFCSHAGVAAKHPWDFIVLCEAVRAKVTCLAIDCILLHWFPYEMGSSPQVWAPTGPVFPVASSLFLYFSPHTSAIKMKTAVMKSWDIAQVFVTLCGQLFS